MKISVLVLCFSLFLLSSALPQGSLTPPGGPAPNMQTLDQLSTKADVANTKLDQLNAKVDTVESKTEKRIPLDATHAPGDATNEFIISQPGSYYLTANIETTKTNGILVNIAGVTRDLNGFRVARASGSGGEGISLAAGASDFVVSNGFLTGWAHGLNNHNAPAGAVHSVRASACSTAGFNISGNGWRFAHCVANDNLGLGIAGGSSAVVKDCLADNNGGVGISANTSSIIGCTATRNKGVAGISAGSSSVVIHCVANNNSSSAATSAGIFA